MQLSRIDFNSAFARLLRPREPEVVEREQPETAESPARAVAANRVTVPLVAFVGFLFLVLLLFVGTAVVGQAKIRADERMIAAYQMVGAMESALDKTKQYLLERQAFGRPLLANQHLSYELADLATDELVEIAGLDEEAATALIMKAREHWFDEDQG